MSKHPAGARRGNAAAAGSGRSAASSTDVPGILKAYFRHQDSRSVTKFAGLADDEYMKNFSLILDSFLGTDFRVLLNRSKDVDAFGNLVKQANYCFIKLQNITHKNPELLDPHVDQISKTLKWWVVQLRGNETELGGLGRAANTVLSAVTNKLRNDCSIGRAVLPGILACLAVQDDALVMTACSAVHLISRSDKNAIAEEVEQVLMALEWGVSGNAAMSLLTALDSIYSRASDPIHAHIDTIAEYVVTHTYAAIGGCLLLTKVAKRCPRMLYAFVENFLPLLSNQTTGIQMVQVFADIAARNALVLAPHLGEITIAAEELGLQYGFGVSIMGYIGRIEPAKAKQVVDQFVKWILDDVDPQATPVLIEQIRNVSGVYKHVLDPHIEELRKLCSHSESRVKDEAEKLIQYYDGEQKFLPTAFLTNQEDLYGRIIEVVNQAVDAKTARTERSIKDILDRVDHQEEKTKDLEEKHYVLVEESGSLDGRVNALELAAKEQEERLTEVEKSIEEVESELQNKNKEIKEFIAQISKKLPVPAGVEAKGIIRKRILLRFECAKGRKPDFIMETASWTKWIRVAISAVSTGCHLAIGDAGGTLKGLMEVYKSLRRKDADPDLKFATLTEQPYLTSAEQDELIEGLRNQGFFDEFEYDPSTAMWERILLEPEEVVEEEEEENEEAPSEEVKPVSAVSAAENAPTTVTSSSTYSQRGTDSKAHHAYKPAPSHENPPATTAAQTAAPPQHEVQEVEVVGDPGVGCCGCKKTREDPLHARLL
eukprot:gb/GECG01000958.1/.p1 GENE.gb/GECG01000958.1/~~gb/GECG01000958.1/.p1  ORF type:complete len:769 (+),score=128.22 gb/GECG01000958.1/:1-2307(+)